MKRNNDAMKSLSLLLVIALTLTPSLLHLSQASGANETITFGNKTNGYYTSSLSGYKHASRYQLTATGAVQSITVHFASVGFNAKVAIYADSRGLPSTLLAQSSSEYIRQTGLHTFTVSQKSLEAGYYWLVIAADSRDAKVSMTLYGPALQTCKGEINYYGSEFTSLFGRALFSDYTSSTWESYGSPNMYATLTASSSPTPTPTPKPTSTPSPSPSSSLQIYWDPSCTNLSSSILWGKLLPGATKSVVIYIRNEGNVALSLSKSLLNFSPTTLSSYMTLNWDYANQRLAPRAVLKVILTLVVSANVTGINNFSFDTIITGTG